MSSAPAIYAVVFDDKGSSITPIMLWLTFQLGGPVLWSAHRILDRRTRVSPESEFALQLLAAVANQNE